MLRKDVASIPLRQILIAVLLVTVGLHRFCRAATPLELLEQQAFQHVLEHVAPSVVRLHLVGGLEAVGTTLLPSGPTSGTVISSDGYVVTSMLPLLAKPAAIVAELANGQRVAAKVVACDYSRQIALLKLDVQEQLPPLEPLPTDQIEVGMWALAVGRGLDGSDAALAVGIISAKSRIWGKALQTDAAISPINYGGPLVDIRGRLLGIIVPLSPTGSLLAGMEWYDSGIGFAVPADYVFRVLPVLREGQNIYPGTMGIKFPAGNPLLVEPLVQAVREGSPAEAAGIRPGDRVIKINGKPVDSAAQVFHIVGPAHAGEKVTLEIVRDGKSKVVELTLERRTAPEVATPYLPEVNMPDGKRKSAVPPHDQSR